jgi:dTDP-glucose pyrophosphorylase
MGPFNNHLLKEGSTIREALGRFNILAKDAILFIVDADNKLKGSLTDGDVRRGFLKGFGLEDKVEQITQPNPRYIRKGELNLEKVIEYRQNNFRIIPILDSENRVVNVVNFRLLKSYLPIDAVVMAGGRGKRLKPLTDTVPKPLLKVGDKAILEHNLNRLTLFGIDDFWISVNYLGEQIEQKFGDGNDKNISIQYVHEDEPLGTIGAASKIDNLEHDYVLVTNSDILTNIDYEHFFLYFLKCNADFAVVTIPYNVTIPYAVLETNNDEIVDFVEKPTYTYYSNGGIYLMKKSVLKFIPKDQFYNTTDLMELLISLKMKVVSYPLLGYWLDIGSHGEFQKAQQDILQINFD